jgi:hypothetical protein
MLGALLPTIAALAIGTWMALAGAAQAARAVAAP